MLDSEQVRRELTETEKSQRWSAAIARAIESFKCEETVNPPKQRSAS
jgi:hypothetical protein